MPSEAFAELGTRRTQSDRKVAAKSRFRVFRPKGQCNRGDRDPQVILGRDG